MSEGNETPTSKVGIVMGSDSDWPVMQAAGEVLTELGVGVGGRRRLRAPDAHRDDRVGPRGAHPRAVGGHRRRRGSGPPARHARRGHPAAGDRRAGAAEVPRRHGLPAVHRPDARRDPGGHRRHRQRQERRHPRRADPGRPATPSSSSASSTTPPSSPRPRTRRARSYARPPPAPAGASASSRGPSPGSAADPAAQRLGLRALLLRLQPSLLRPAGRPGGAPRRRRWRQGLAQHLGQPLARGDAVAVLRAVLGGRDRHRPVGPAPQRAGALGGGEDRRGGDVELELDARVGGVDGLAARSGRLGEPLDQLGCGHDQAVGQAGSGRDVEVAHDPIQPPQWG